MCLAIAPVSRERSGRLQRLWRPLSASPLRLLAVGAALHGVILIALGASGRLPDGPDAPGVQIATYYGIAGSVLLGFLLTWLPSRFRREAVHYAVYTTIWFLMITGMALLEAGLWQGRGWHAAGAMVLLLAWVVALRALYWIVLWVWGQAGRLLGGLLLLLVAGAAGLPLQVLAVLTDSPLLQRYPHGAISLTVGLLVLAALGYLAWHREAEPARTAG